MDLPFFGGFGRGSKSKQVVNSGRFSVVRAESSAEGTKQSNGAPGHRKLDAPTTGLTGRPSLAHAALRAQYRAGIPSIEPGLCIGRQHATIDETIARPHDEVISRPGRHPFTRGSRKNPRKFLR
ncbi:hypothetical protein [Paraburkholderia sp. 32]|uniref:hypothetical protein n=1 Tax=unclassified Paraburkholderia TaxID=2615204 RepID=UPI003D2342EE